MVGSPASHEHYRGPQTHSRQWHLRCTEQACAMQPRAAVRFYAASRQKGGKLVACWILGCERVCMGFAAGLIHHLESFNAAVVLHVHRGL